MQENQTNLKNSKKMIFIKKTPIFSSHTYLKKEL
jgi:hypothetical protein